MSLVKDRLHKYKKGSIFVETGTFLGVGCMEAIKAGFKEVHTIEILEENYKKADINFIASFFFVILFQATKFEIVFAFVFLLSFFGPLNLKGFLLLFFWFSFLFFFGQPNLNVFLLL